jgi:hypothetical protein
VTEQREDLPWFGFGLGPTIHSSFDFFEAGIGTEMEELLWAGVF